MRRTTPLDAIAKGGGFQIAGNTAFPFARSLDIVQDEDIEPGDDPANHGADSEFFGI